MLELKFIETFVFLTVVLLFMIFGFNVEFTLYFDFDVAFYLDLLFTVFR